MPCLSLLVFPCLPPAAHAATFQSFDVPGAAGTCGSAIASNGLVAGNTVVPQSVTIGRTAPPAMTPFLYAAGQFAFPHANLPSGTVYFSGVNKDRAIVATVLGGLSPPFSTSFVYRHGKVTMPQAGSLPVVSLAAVSDKGVLLGESRTQPAGPFGVTRLFAFLRAPDGVVAVIDDGVSSLTPRAMDARADRVVGTAFGPPGAGGWMFADGVFTPVSYPGSSFTIPTGVDEQGTVSGSYVTGDAASGEALASHGFFLRHGTYTTYDVKRPGVTSTAIGGMNEAGQITGCHIDAKGMHGFVETP